jgi:hypothetical protein
MKHLLNDIPEWEINSIREQHNGGMSIDTSKFKKLLESIGGNVKPLVTEEVTNSIVKIHKNFGGNPDENFFMLAQKVKGSNGFIYNCVEKVMRVGDGPGSYKAEDFGLDPNETQTKIDGVCKKQMSK